MSNQSNIPVRVEHDLALFRFYRADDELFVVELQCCNCFEKFIAPGNAPINDLLEIQYAHSTKARRKEEAFLDMKRAIKDGLMTIDDIRKEFKF